MSRKSVVSAITSMMEMGPDPVSGMGGQDAMGTAEIEVGMEIMPGDGLPFNDVECDGEGFHPDDYAMAKELIANVGGPERARELIDNLDEVLETLDLQPANDEDSIAFIAGHVPDDVGSPTDGGFE